jgi:hypothetical protein
MDLKVAVLFSLVDVALWLSHNSAKKRRKSPK